MTFVDSRLLLSNFDFFNLILDFLTLDFLLSTFLLSTFSLNSRLLLSTLEPRPLDTLVLVAISKYSQHSELITLLYFIRCMQLGERDVGFNYASDTIPGQVGEAM